MKAKINFDGNRLSDVEIGLYRYPLYERVKRSFKTFSIFFGAAIFSVLIPVLHFFLVPIFLILSFVLSYQKFKEIISVDLAGIICPECKIGLRDKAVGLKENDLVVRLSCDSCRKNFTIIFEENANELSKI